MDEILFKMKYDRSELIVYDNRIIIISKKQGERNNCYQYANIGDIKAVLITPTGENIGCIKFVLNGDDSELCFNIKKKYANQENLRAFEIKAFIDDKITVKREEKSLIPMQEIKNLSILLQDGVITQEEFDIKKKQLLGL